VALVTGVEATERPRAAAPRLVPPLAERTRRWWRHWPLALVLAAALALRVLAFVAIYPGIWFTDSNGYVQVGATGTLLLDRVSGYGVLVAPFWRLGSAAALIGFQHLLGLALVVVMYALLVHRGMPRWLAALAVAPVALDAYVLAVEHAIMSDTLFDFTLVAAIALLLWRERPSLWTIAVAGLLLGFAGLVRSVGAPFVAVFIVYLVVRRLGWRPLVAFAVPWVLITVAYATLFDIQTGRFGLNTSTGRYMYGQVAHFADCSRLPDLPADERLLCPTRAQRLSGHTLMWGAHSPVVRVPAGDDSRVRDFALRVIRRWPLTYLQLVAHSFVHYFEPGHPMHRTDYKPTPWQFPTDPATPAFPGYRGPIRPHRVGDHWYYPSRYVSRMVAHPRTNARASRLLRHYQRYVYTQGPLLAVCVVLAVVALFRRGRDWRLRIDAALLAAATLAALFVAAALSVFSYRYVLPAVVLLPPAGALGLAALLGRRLDAPRRHDGRAACSRTASLVAAD
jgi:hypothetical protein